MLEVEVEDSCPVMVEVEVGDETGPLLDFVRVEDVLVVKFVVSAVIIVGWSDGGGELEADLGLVCSVFVELVVVLLISVELEVASRLVSAGPVGVVLVLTSAVLSTGLAIVEKELSKVSELEIASGLVSAVEVEMLMPVLVSVLVLTLVPLSY